MTTLEKIVIETRTTTTTLTTTLTTTRTTETIVETTLTVDFRNKIMAVTLLVFDMVEILPMITKQRNTIITDQTTEMINNNNSSIIIVTNNVLHPLTNNNNLVVDLTQQIVFHGMLLQTTTTWQIKTKENLVFQLNLLPTAITMQMNNKIEDPMFKVDLVTQRPKNSQIYKTNLMRLIPKTCSLLIQVT